VELRKIPLFQYGAMPLAEVNTFHLRIYHQDLSLPFW